jgi:hypothetical protein
MMTTTELQEIRNVFRGLETLYQTYLPKVDPTLIHELLIREQDKTQRAPFYMVEVFTKNGTDSQWCKDHIWNTTGFVPAIYDKGTHYVTIDAAAIPMAKPIINLLIDKIDPQTI